MVFFAIKFEDKHDNIEVFSEEILLNSEKPAAKLLFNVKTYCIDSDILAIHKVFIPSKVISVIYVFVLVACSLVWLHWQIIAPLLVFSGLLLLWSFLNTAVFNFIMFKIMISKLGYKGRLKLL